MDSTFGKHLYDGYAVAALTHFALDKLWEATADGDGCCPRCCAPCHTLKQISATIGGIEWYLTDWPETLEGTGWWDARHRRVDRDWLRRAWANADQLGCHAGDH